MEDVSAMEISHWWIMKTYGEQKKPDSYLLYSSISMKFKYRQN